MEAEKVKTKLQQPLVLRLDPEKEREYELRCIKEDARIDGLAEGRAKGIAEGRAEGRQEEKKQCQENERKWHIPRLNIQNNWAN